MIRNSTRSSASNPERIRPAVISDLKERSLFEEVDDAALEELVKYSFICQLDAQKPLHTARERVDHIYIIRSGYVAIWVTSQFTDMGESFLAWRGPEQIINEMRPVDGGPPIARIVTCDPCEFIEIRSDVFTDVANCPNLIYRNIARLLVKKMEHERCRSEIIRMSPAKRQVAQTLLHLAHERYGDEPLNKSNEINIPGIIHQEEIAGYVGSDRATINRELSEFKKNDIITYVKSSKGSPITILNREALERIARSPSPRSIRKGVKTTP